MYWVDVAHGCCLVSFRFLCEIHSLSHLLSFGKIEAVGSPPHVFAQRGLHLSAGGGARHIPVQGGPTGFYTGNRSSLKACCWRGVTLVIGYCDYHLVTNIGYCDYFPKSRFQMPCLPCLQWLLPCDNFCLLPFAFALTIFWPCLEVVTISDNQCMGGIGRGRVY